MFLQTCLGMSREKIDEALKVRNLINFLLTSFTREPTMPAVKTSWL